MNPFTFWIPVIALPVLALIWSRRAGPRGPWRGRFIGGMLLLGLAIAVLLDGGGNIPLYMLVGAIGLALVVLGLVGRDRQIERERDSSSA